MSRFRDLDQAKRCLADPILGERLRQNVRLMLRQKDKSALQLLGSPDDLKFCSCQTLFARAASDELIRRFRACLPEVFIGQEILEHYEYRGQVMRVMFTAQNSQTIRDAFGRAKPNSEHARLYAAAVARRQADQIYNLSLTRTATVILGEARGESSGLVA